MTSTTTRGRPVSSKVAAKKVGKTDMKVTTNVVDIAGAPVEPEPPFPVTVEQMLLRGYHCTLEIDPDELYYEVLDLIGGLEMPDLAFADSWTNGAASTGHLPADPIRDETANEVLTRSSRSRNWDDDDDDDDYEDEEDDNGNLSLNDRLGAFDIRGQSFRYGSSKKFPILFVDKKGVPIKDVAAIEAAARSVIKAWHQSSSAQRSPDIKRHVDWDDKGNWSSNHARFLVAAGRTSAEVLGVDIPGIELTVETVGKKKYLFAKGFNALREMNTLFNNRRLHYLLHEPYSSVKKHSFEALIVHGLTHQNPEFIKKWFPRVNGKTVNYGGGSTDLKNDHWMLAGKWEQIRFKELIFSSQLFDNFAHIQASVIPFSEERFIKLWVGRMSGIVAKKVESLETEMRRVERLLLSTAAQLGDQRTTLRIMEEGGTAFYTSKLAELKNIANIEKIEFVSTGLEVTTTDIWYEPTNKDLQLGKSFEGKRFFGKYKICIDPFGHSMTLQNLMLAKQNAYSHPTSMSNGATICLGSYNSILSEALKELDYYVLLLTMVDFLASAHLSDSFAREKFPGFGTVKPKTKIAGPIIKLF